MTILQSVTVEDVRADVASALRGAIDRLDPRTRLVCGYHLGFWDAQGRPGGGGGKGLRPRLAVLSAQAAGAPASAGIPAAAACELVHNFSLLHDDIMDGDRERRHRPTAWAEFGAPAAILAGDSMVTLAFELLAESSSPTSGWAMRALATTTRRLIAGQASDLAFEQATSVTLEDCLRMAGDKTAALLQCSSSLGALLVEAPARLVLGLGTYGEHLGLAFQLTDDLLGLWGMPEATGKPLRSDLRSRKMTVPVVAALTSGTAAGTELAQIYQQADPLSEDDLARAARLVERAGGRSWTEDRVTAEVHWAAAALEPLDLPASVADELVRHAQQLQGRQQ